MSLETYGWLVLLFPLAGTVLIGLTFRVLPSKVHGYLGTLAIALSFASAIGALFALQDLSAEERQVTTVAWDYANTVGVDAQLSLLLDPLSVFMALVVSGVSTLIHLYSISYMASDRGYTRFFAYLNFFVFSMLLLVLAGNFFFLIVGWAFVGAASYLLISFWYRRTTATAAGIKAFVINVVGDAGLVLGTYFLFKQTGSLDFLQAFASADEFSRNDGDVVAGCLLLLVGAFAKSAQVPLHTWLPDAMEGPTPVSALIHAATMVTAGVYLIARMHPFFEQAPSAADVGAIIGCATLLIAATIGLVVTDLKRVIAYSTMSQIGYMVMAVCSFAYVSGLFHLMTHAFFKALLFMAAGSVISAMAGEQNLDKMGGFRRAMPYTFGCMVIGGLSLTGVPPFAGFFSKDEILAFTLARDDWHIVLGVLGYVGSFLTAIYTWRMIFRAFYGPPVEPARELEGGHLHHAPEPFNPASGEVEDTDVGFPGPDHHIAEREWSMKVAMGLLAVGATFAGVLQIPKVTDVLHTFLEPSLQRLALLRDARAVRLAHVDRARGRRGARVRRHRTRVPAVGRGPRAPDRDGLAPAARPALPPVLAQVVLRRDHRHARRPPVRDVRPLRARRVRAGRRQRPAHRRPDGRGPRRLGRGARHAVRLPALLRRPAAARRHLPRPLLPHRRLVTIHLSFLLFFPLVLAMLGGLMPRTIAPLALLVGSLVSLVYAVLMLFDFQTGSARLQYVTDERWIPDLGVRYTLGVDGLNLWLIALTALLFSATALWILLRPPSARVKLYAFHVGLAETAVLGAFMAQDLMLFVLFFDLMLVPFYFLVGQWGGPDRVAATFKLVVYTLVGSLLMLAAAVATGVTAGAGPGGDVTFSIQALAARADLGESTQRWLFVAFALAFLIKMPAFPFHGWMPDGYRNMPLPVLAVFSAVLSKVAAYGFLRIVLPIFPDATQDFQTLMLLIALASILYGSAQAFTQTNARLILGYSSVAQLGFITLGIFALGEAAGAQGALLQMLNHGLVVAPLFFIVALLRRADGHGGHPRDGRRGVPRAGARGAVPDRRARDARDARLGELRGRVPDPARACSTPSW